MSGLEPYLRAARELRPESSSGLDVAAIARGSAAARKRRRGQTAAGVATLGAVLAVLWWGGSDRVTNAEQPVAETADARPVQGAGANPSAARNDAEVVHETRPARGQHARTGPDAVVATGTYSIVRDGQSISTPAGELWLDGRAKVSVDAEEVIVRLEFGVAAFDDGDAVVMLESESFRKARPAPRSEGSRPTATDLARRAEEQLLAGKRKAARRTLSKLVKQFPRSAEAKTALLDIATISRRLGEQEKAACALERFIGAWPDDPRVSTARVQRARLPEADCRR